MASRRLTGERQYTAQAQGGAGGWSSYLEADLEDDAAAGAWIDETAEAGRRSKVIYEREWFLNIARYAGYQWTEYDRGSALQVPEQPPWRVRIVVNRIVGYVRTLVAKLLKNRPIPIVQPATNDAEDVSTARTGEKVLKMQWDRQDMDSVLQEALVWLFTCGAVALKVGWDSQTGEVIDLPERAEEPPPTNGRIYAKLEDAMESIGAALAAEVAARAPGVDVSLGDVATWIRTPFDILTPPDAIRFKDCAWMMEVVSMSVAEAEERYGVTGLASDADTRYGIGYFHDRIQRLVGPGGVGGDATYTEANAVYVKELWVKPSKRHPRGRHVIRAGGRTIVNEEFPPGVRRIPIFWMEEIKIPGRIWPSSTTEQLWPCQAGYNRSRSQIIESQNLMSKPKWLVPQEAEIGEDQITSEPGEVIEYRAGYKPEMVPPPEIPQYVGDHQNRLVGEMDDIAGVRDISKAQAPTGLESGIALSILQEADDTRLGPLNMLQGRLLSAWGRATLEQIEANYEESRLIRVVGQSGMVDAFEFLGKDLSGKNVDRPGADYFDVRFEMGSQLPTMRAARQQFLLQLLQYQVFNFQEPGQREFFLKMLDLNVPDLYEAAALDRPMADAENRLMAHGERIAPKTWENHPIHLQVLDEFRKKPEFSRLGPDIQAIFEEHANGHRILMAGGPQAVALQQAQMGQAMLQAQAPPQGAAQAAQEAQAAAEGQSVQEVNAKLDAILAMLQQQAQVPQAPPAPGVVIQADNVTVPTQNSLVQAPRAGQVTAPSQNTTIQGQNTLVQGRDIGIEAETANVQGDGVNVDLPPPPAPVPVPTHTRATVRRNEAGELEGEMTTVPEVSEP